MKKTLLFIVIILMVSCSNKPKSTEELKAIVEASDYKETATPLDSNSYEILEVVDNNSVDNYYVLIKRIDINKNSIQEFSDKFREKYCNKVSNINMIDDRNIFPTIKKYPLKGEEYVTVADHFVALSDFSDGWIWMYPYQDVYYDEQGGKNRKNKEQPKQISTERTTTLKSNSTYSSRINQQCLSASSVSDFKELNRISNKKDKNSLIKMISSGQVYVLDSGTKVKVLDRGFGKKRVETENGLKVWVSTEFVTE